MLGLATAKRTLNLGRSAFFDHGKPDLPQGRSALLQADDLTPQFGFVGAKYQQTRILLIGINPGNGPKNDMRTPRDSRMMPALVTFAHDPTKENFANASVACQTECQHWPLWKRHCSEIIGAGKLSLDDIAYSNCLPWRTESRSNFDLKVALKAAQLYALPLIEELKPRLIVALGKRANFILNLAGGQLPRIIVWNRAQAATATVLQDRASAAAQILSFVNNP
jgi:hypothetical protein